ncbi:hypothetical protein Tco_1168495, partial [Tanacetum coccineum]
LRVLHDYAAKYLNFDNITPVDTKVVSMLDINVQHEAPPTTSTTVVPDSKTLTALHQRVDDLEKDVKELKTIDHSATLLSNIKAEVPKAIKEYLGTTEIVERLRQQYVPEKSMEDISLIKMEHARKQQVPKATITSSDTAVLEDFDQKTALFQTMTNSKSFNRSPKQRDLYHALMESILKDEDAMDEEFSKGTSKSQPKSTGKSAQAEETVFEAGDTQEPQNQGQDKGNTNDQPNVKAALKHDWFKKHERPPTPDPDWNARKTVEFRPPQTWISKSTQAKKPPLSFDELMSTPINFSTYVMNNLKIDNLTQYLLVGPAFNLLKGTCKSQVELEYNFEECYKAVTDRLRIVILNHMEDLRLGFKSYQKKLNITKPETFINRLMHSDELYKFSDEILTSVRTILLDIPLNLRMDYLPKRRWSNLDRQRSRIMIKAIDKLQLE